jgi:ATP-dependent RNA helicase DeaD
MKLKTEISELIEKDAANDYTEFAKELLEEGKQPEKVIASLLCYALKDTLNPHSYREISSVISRNNANNNLVRLFVAKGHMDRMNAEKVAQFVANEAAVDVNTLRDIRVFDKFSFLSAPAMEAEQILVVFSKNKRNGRSIVTRAKEKDGSSYKKFDDRKSKYNEEKKYYDDQVGDKNLGKHKLFGEKRNGSERKKFSAKPEFKKDFVKTETNAEQKPRKHENKLTTYLDKPSNASKPEKKKKQDTSELEKFMKKFDDDLSW